MMAVDKRDIEGENDTFSDAHEVLPGAPDASADAQDRPVIPPEDDADRERNDAAIAKAMEEDIKAATTKNVSTASDAAKRSEESKAAQAQSQAPQSTSRPPSHRAAPAVPTRQTSSAGMAGVGAGGGVPSNLPHTPGNGSTANSSGSWISNPVAALHNRIVGRPTSESSNVTATNRTPTNSAGFTSTTAAHAGTLNAPTGGQETVEALYAQLRTLQAENRTLRDDKRKITNSLGEQEVRNRSLETTLRTNETQKRQQNGQITVLSREAADVRHENQKLVHELNITREEYAMVEQERMKYATQLSETQKLLESRTLELRTAETFLTKYDDTPGDEVVGMVGDINAQILNIGGRVADDIAEVFPQEVGVKDRDRQYQHSTFETLNIVIGGKIVDILLRSDYMEDPTPVSLAIQSLLTNGISTMLSTWPLMPNNDFSRDFWNLYKGILKSGTFLAVIVFIGVV